MVARLVRDQKAAGSNPATSTFFIGFVKANPFFVFVVSIRIPPNTPLSAAIRKRPVKADGCNGAAHMAVSVRLQYSSVWHTFYSGKKRAGKTLCHVGGVIA